MLKMFPVRSGVAVQVATLLVLLGASASGAFASEPWTPAQLISPEALHKRLGEAKGAKPLLIHVGFWPLYEQAHIPGSQFHGPAARPEGVRALKEHVQKLPRNQEIILYCGCCPWDECPNIRPAFRALKEMGFTHLKVLSIPTNLATDWAGKGYPLEKGK